MALSVSDTTIYRTVESGSLNCELAGHHKAAQTPNSEAIKYTPQTPRSRRPTIHSTEGCASV